MSDLLNVQATTREDIGKGASRRLRHEKNVPAVVYGAGKEAVSLTLELKEVMKHVNFEKFFSSILNIFTQPPSIDIIINIICKF